MKKLLTLAVLALSAFGLYAQDAEPVVDTFSYTDVGGNSNGDYYNGTFSGTAGTYTFNDLLYWFDGILMKSDHTAYVSGVAEGYKLTKVQRNGGAATSAAQFTVYASNEPLTYDNCTNAPFSAALSGASSVSVSGEYQHVLVRLTPGSGTEGGFDDLIFSWEANGPVGPKVTGDSFTVANFEEKYPQYYYDSQSFAEKNVNPDFNITLTSGANYDVHGMFAHKDETDASKSWWALNNAGGEENGYITVTAPASNMWIESVEITSGSSWGSICFGTQELTAENYKEVGQYEANYSLDNSEGTWPNIKYNGTLKPQQPSQYLFYDTNGQEIYDVTVNWTADKPSYTVETPTLNCWDSPFTNASKIDYSCGTRLAKLKIEVYTKDSADAEYVKNEAAGFTTESNYGSFEMPGLPGQYVKIVAVGVLDGCTDSQPVEKEFGPLEMADAPSPQFVETTNYVTAGAKLSIGVGEGGRWGEPLTLIEGATVKYQYTIKDADGATVSTSEEVTGTTNPVEVAVPATVVPGQTFELVASSVMENRKSTSNTFSLPVISDVLPAPTFSLPSGSDMPAGSKIRVIKPEFADSLFFTVNGGEVQKYTWSPDVEIKEESVIEAWATSKNLKPSEHVTATFKIEVLEAWMDAIEPSCFVDGTEWQQYAAEARNYESTYTDVKYVYNGRFMSDYSKPLDNNYSAFAGNFDFYPATYLTNLNAYDKKGETQIKSIKIDSDKSGSVYVAFSDNVFEPVTTDSDLCKADYAGDIARVTVGGSNAADKDFVFGQWIELKGLNHVEGDGAKYFMVFSGENNYIELSRVVVHYWDPKDGVSSIVTEDVEGAVYSINGYRVNSENLAPGVYVRKQNGKTVKFVVK